MLSLEEDLEFFYDQIEYGLRNVRRRDICVILGDWNAKIGSVNTSWGHVMGPYGIGVRNDRGERLLQFAQEKNMFICNTKYPNKPSRKWTWTSPSGRDRNMIDYVLILKNWANAIHQCRSFPSADISSDHALVLCNMSVQLNRYRKRQPTLKKNSWDSDRLKDEVTQMFYRGTVTLTLEEH